MRIVTGGCDNRIRFWNRINSSQKWEIDSAPIDTSVISHTDWVRDVAWAPSIMPDTNIVASCSEDRTVIIWTQQLKKNNDNANVNNDQWKPFLLNTFQDPVWRVSWSITGSILAVSSGDNHVSLWKHALEGNWVQVSSVQDS
jgi:protein transport protein SEC13